MATPLFCLFQFWLKGIFLPNQIFSIKMVFFPQKKKYTETECSLTAKATFQHSDIFQCFQSQQFIKYALFQSYTHLGKYTIHCKQPTKYILFQESQDFTLAFWSPSNKIPLLQLHPVVEHCYSIFFSHVNIYCNKTSYLLYKKNPNTQEHYCVTWSYVAKQPPSNITRAGCILGEQEGGGKHILQNSDNLNYFLAYSFGAIL